MRAIFSIIGLLVVVVIVLMLGRNQLNALGYGRTASPAAPSGATTHPAAPATVPEPVRNIQQRTQQDVQRALEAGMQQRASEPAQ